MSSPLRLLFAASEVAPMTKTGGLADVAAALPVALRELDIDVRVLLPGYAPVMSAITHVRPLAELPALGVFPECKLLAAQGPFAPRRGGVDEGGSGGDPKRWSER